MIYGSTFAAETSTLTFLSPRTQNEGPFTRLVVITVGHDAEKNVSKLAKKELFGVSRKNFVDIRKSRGDKCQRFETVIKRSYGGPSTGNVEISEETISLYISNSVISLKVFLF